MAPTALKTGFQNNVNIALKQSYIGKVQSWHIADTRNDG